MGFGGFMRDNEFSRVRSIFYDDDLKKERNIEEILKKTKDVLKNKENYSIEDYKEACYNYYWLYMLVISICYTQFDRVNFYKGIDWGNLFYLMKKLKFFERQLFKELLYKSKMICDGTNEKLDKLCEYFGDSEKRKLIINYVNADLENKRKTAINNLNLLARYIVLMKHDEKYKRMYKRIDVTMIDPTYVTEMKNKLYWFLNFISSSEYDQTVFEAVFESYYESLKDVIILLMNLKGEDEIVFKDICGLNNYNMDYIKKLIKPLYIEMKNNMQKKDKEKKK